MIEKVTLKNGVRLVFEHIPHVRSVTCGIWVVSGSRYEPKEINGISHFIEHMVFKGTKNRSAIQIVHEMDMLGGQINAFTSKEYSCFHVKCLDENLYQALDILTDIYLNPKFDEKDIENEKKVVLEEINMYLDTYEELVSETLVEQVWQESSLCMPILGIEDTINKLDKNLLIQYMKENYCSKNTLISVAGSFSKEELVKFIEDKFGSMQGEEPTRENPPALFTPKEIYLKRDISQNHLCFFFEGIGRESDMVYPLVIASNILGEGMGSRLFQTIREKNGLCYSVYSFNMSHINSGIVGIYAAYNSEQQNQIIKLIKEVTDDFAKNGVTEEEFIRAKQQFKVNVIMGFENTSSRMPHMARSELLKGKILTLDETIKKIENVTIDDVNSISKKVFDIERYGLSIIGKEVK